MFRSTLLLYTTRLVQWITNSFVSNLAPAKKEIVLSPKMCGGERRGEMCGGEGGRGPRRKKMSVDFFMDVRTMYRPTPLLYIAGG